MATALLVGVFGLLGVIVGGVVNGLVSGRLERGGFFGFASVAIYPRLDRRELVI